MIQQVQSLARGRFKAMAAMFILLLAVVAACNWTWWDVPPGLQIVVNSRHRVYLADWLGSGLDPELLTDFTGAVSIRALAASAPGDVIGVLGKVQGTETIVFHFIDPSTGRYKKIFEAHNPFQIFGLAIAPGNQAIAFISRPPQRNCPGIPSLAIPERGRDVIVYDLRARRAHVVVCDRAGWDLSWTPGGEQLTYDTREGWIESVTLKTQGIERLVQGVRAYP